MEKIEEVKPGLFGLENSNRNFTKASCWGKNQFNSSFPASLACYMSAKEIPFVYLKLNENLKVTHDEINFEDTFGLPALSPNLHFAFETVYSSFAPLAEGSVPRADLVTINKDKQPSELLRAIEVKLTALPDSTTYKLDEESFGCELVIRPDTIVYLGLDIAEIYREERGLIVEKLSPIVKQINNWEEIEEVKSKIPLMATAIDEILLSKLESQNPFLMQPVWKTIGKSGVLANQCFDIFVWSSFSLTRLFFDNGRVEKKTGISRNSRSIVWLFAMIWEFGISGKIDFHNIIDKLTYNTKNDKAFAVSGVVTNPYMKGKILETPRIGKESVKEIILGNGQDFLSPERRLDAAILNTPGLF